MPVSVVNDAAEGCCEGTKELDFGLIFVAAGFIHISIDEALHRVNVQDVPCDYVVGI